MHLCIIIPGITLFRLVEAPVKYTTRPSYTATSTIRALPTMPLRSLRLKMLKTFKISPTQALDAKYWVWLRRGEDEWAFNELDADADAWDIDRFGFEDGSGIGVLLR